MNILKQNKQSGFTLLEVLVALALFALVASITASVLYYAFNTQARVSQQMNRLNTLSLAITLIEHDTSQIIERAVRSNNMHLFAPFIGSKHYCEFTRNGIANPGSMQKRSTLQRLAYLCKNGQLIRRAWTTLDSISRKHYTDKLLLDGVQDCQFAYLNSSLQVLAVWSANALRQDQSKEPFPQAIQLGLTLKNWGNMNLLFIIPGAHYVEL